MEQKQDSLDFSKLNMLFTNSLEPKLQFKIFDMIDERPIRVIDELDPNKFPYSEQLIQDLCEDRCDYSIVDDLFQGQSLELLKRAREEGMKLTESGHLNEAGYGRGEEYKKSKKVRGDQFVWLSKLTKNNQNYQDIDGYQALKELSQRMAQFKNDFNQHLGESQLDDQEIQLALYEGKGEFYLRHKDAFRLDLNNIKNGQKLRKMTTIIYLNENLPQKEEKIPQEVGQLRIYLKNEIIDVVPRMGRVIMFKSEKIEHEVKPTKGYQRFALTSWFHHTYKKEEQKLEEEKEEEDYKIFIGIVAYRDPQLVPTVQNLIEGAGKKETLVFGIFIQNDLNSEEDKQITNSLQELQNQHSCIEFRIEIVSHQEARNAYYARYRMQKLFNQEKYYLQIDSHMRFTPGWDSLLIKFINQCQNPQNSILTQYPKNYNFKDTEFKQSGPLAMCFKEFSKIDGLPRFLARVIKREDKFERSYKALFWAAGMSFSYGKLIEECGYSNEVDDVFFGEEIFQMMKFYRKGYEMYSPPRNIVYHYWSRDYRKTYKQDHSGDKERLERQNQCLEHIRSEIVKDKEFVQNFKEKTGVDLINKTFTDFSLNGGLDPQFF